jgi:hypothetical protein
MLAVIVALHAYAQWSISNIDRTTGTTNREHTSVTRSDLRARPGDLSAIAVRAHDAPPRHRWHGSGSRIICVARGEGAGAASRVTPS